MSQPVPAPVNPETAPYAAALREGRLLIKVCAACGESHFYPRALCPFCFSDRTEWREASGRGAIYAVSILRAAGAASALAYVTLAEGPRMMTSIVDCDPLALAVDTPVRLVIRPGADGTLAPMFTPMFTSAPAGGGQ